jgi:hypothetical protein
MATKVPIRTVFDGDGNATGLAEFQTGEFIDYQYGGTGVASIGTAGQVLKVNSGGTALEYGNVQAIIDIDTATDLTAQTLTPTDLLIASDGGTEGKITLAQIDTLFKGTTQTFTNKSISGSTNTLSDIGNSSISSGIDAAKLGDGSVSNTEFQYISTLASNAQDQLNAKAEKSFAIAQAIALG